MFVYNFSHCTKNTPHKQHAKVCKKNSALERRATFIEFGLNGHFLKASSCEFQVVIIALHLMYVWLTGLFEIGIYASMQIPREMKKAKVISSNNASDFNFSLVNQFYVFLYEISPGQPKKLLTQAWVKHRFEENYHKNCCLCMKLFEITNKHFFTYSQRVAFCFSLLSSSLSFHIIFFLLLLSFFQLQKHDVQLDFACCKIKNK